MIRVLLTLSLILITLVSFGCKEKSSKKTSNSQVQTTESPVVGTLKRSGAIKSSFACVQNYIPENKDAVLAMKNSSFVEVDSCIDQNYRFACVKNDLKNMAPSQIGFINWYGGASGCSEGFTGFTDEKAAMEFLQQRIEAAQQ